MDAETLRWAGTLALTAIGALVIWVFKSVVHDVHELRLTQRQIMKSMDVRMALIVAALYALQTELHPEARDIISRTMNDLMRGVKNG